MKQIMTLITTALLLLSCKDTKYSQADIDALNKQREECRSETEELQEQYSTSRAAVEKSLKKITSLEDSLREMTIQTKLLNISIPQRTDDEYTHFFRNGYPGDLTQPLFCGDKSGVLNALMAEKESGKCDDYGILSLIDRITYVKGGRIPALYDRSDSTGLSNNHNRNSPKFIFEYLGDCLGNNIAYGFRDNHKFTNTILENFRDEQLNQLIDYICRRVIIVLDNNWKSEDEKKSLISALDHVLETTKSVDYSAKITTNEGGWRNIFVNKTYETEWNGIQKFFYRTEKRFPGSTKRILLNVEKYRDSLL